MPITLREKIDSRESQTGESRSVTLLYDLDGTADDLAAKALAEASTPPEYDGLARLGVGLEPQGVDTVTGSGRWLVTARYGQPSAPQTGESTFSFDTGGGTQHVTQSLATVARYPPATAPDFAGAIGVTHDNVEGVDVTVPVYQFSETHYLAAELVTDAYKGKLFRLTGKVNAAAFRGLAAGECLFLGASGSKRGGEDDWEVTFRFAGSPNVTGLTIGSITGINKKGWEYLWVRYADTEDENAKVLVKRPVAAYVEKVYELGDFADLGIGS